MLICVLYWCTLFYILSRVLYVLYNSLVLIGTLRHDTDQVEEVVRLVAQQVLQVAHESVHVSLASSLMDNVFVVVISKSAGQFLVVHFGFVLAQAPSSSNLIRVNHLELPSLASPAAEVLARLVRQQLQDELPQLDGSRGCQGGGSCWLLLDWRSVGRGGPSRGRR